MSSTPLGREPRNLLASRAGSRSDRRLDYDQLSLCEDRKTMVGILVALTFPTALGCDLSAGGFFAFSERFVIENPGAAL